jgi:hypothetical protein
MGENSKSGGIGFTGLLQLAFIVLKLLKVIDWPWVWVLAPIWAIAGLYVLIFAGCFIIVIIRRKK